MAETQMVPENPFAEIKEMMALLVSDALRSYALQETDAQCFRRVYARTVFGLIEALNDNMKQIALWSHLLGGLKPTAAEISLLKEEAYDLNENGEPRRKRNYLDLSRNVRFTFKVCARLFECDFSVRPDDDWKAFVNAIEIRNRLSRPKTVDDLTISDQELETIDKAHDWYRKALLDILRSIRRSDDNKR